MPKLPDFTDLGERPAPQGAGGIASYSPSPTNIGAGIAAAGGDLQQAAMVIAETNHRQDQMAAESAVNRLNLARLDLEAGDQGFKNVRGGAAVGSKFLDTYQQRFNSVSSEIEQSLTSESQRKLYQQRLPVANLQYRTALLQHQAKEVDSFNDKTESDTVDFARRQIFENPNQPQAIEAGFSRIDWAIDQRATRLGWDQTTTAETKAKFREKVYEDSASIQVEQNPTMALAAIDRRMGIGQDAQPSGLQAFDSLNPDKLVTLRHRAASYVTLATNKAEAEQKKRLKDADDEVKDLQTFVLGGQMVSPAYEQSVLTKVIGTPFEMGARTLIQGSYAGAMHGSLPLSTQEQRLRQMDTAAVQGGSSPTEAAIVKHLRETTNIQKTAYKENPWAAATRFGRQPEVQEQNITSADQVPQLVAGRLPLMNGVETFAGQPVSPLQPAEAKAWADKLGALPPDAKAEALGQTGAMLSVPRVAALADQLDKHDKPLALALKMGLDRTTAGRAASSLVLRGAQALADKSVKKDDTPGTGWESEISKLVRGTLGDPRAEQDVIDAAYYVRAAQELDGSQASGFRALDRGAEEAVAMVIGRPIERSGVKTFLPRGMKESDFNDKLDAYTPSKLREFAPSGQVYVRGQPVKVEQIASRLGSYGLKRDGKGAYIPVVNNAPITLDAQGTQLLRLEVR